MAAFPNSVLIREYTPADLDALRRMHARQGFDYAFPDLADPIFVSKLVVEDDGGRAVMASLARLTCEMYLLAGTAAGQGIHANATRDCSRCTRPANATSSRAAWTTRTRGSRRRSRAASDAASKRSAGSATTPGRRTAAACAPWFLRRGTIHRAPTKPPSQRTRGSSY